MTDEKMVTVSSFAKDEYGISAATIEAMINYGYALLAIAGADQEVSEKEMEWLINHQTKFGAPQEVVELYKSFDYKNANIKELLSKIKVDVATWSAPPNLIYHGIHMSSADGVYAEAERETVKQAAKILGVADDVVLTLESLVDMERAVVRMRKALFHIDAL
ncbi:MAG: hypothetical protein F6K36_03190 [Symploca sp. SIO3C6]|uniref:Co-chaperone DjlA N-terminal domain-containing protein n=1 Tax=Symploca sp. SIO1C4 TaxID=2607765 RepID=A0A6B3NA35_9CYAN|nr:hypothetical protein [Symploca sp. SIO3C6]NER28373.1 hypothetical protein [Symploca sp. SIO1C4]NET03875.1 hypothetical protein [Symploca sp. SIO2B6]NET51744.1 hypothetical protein [Merismopedia sp. SIO2A8]